MMWHFSRNCVLLGFLAGAAIAPFRAASQEPESAAPQQQAIFSKAIDAYSTCLLQTADSQLLDSNKTAETIADESHVACKGAFATASDAALIYAAALVPKRGHLQAVVFSMEQMGRYKAQMRGIVMKHVADKRSENAP